MDTVATHLCGLMPKEKNPGSNITLRQSRESKTSLMPKLLRWLLPIPTIIPWRLYVEPSTKRISHPGVLKCRLCLSRMPLRIALIHSILQKSGHTAIIPITVGRLVLNRNPENFFAQIEQAAFEPANMVPGIGPSPDKMLLGRLFSYPDTHRYRIGPNYLQLPVNQPKNEVHSYNKDGAMRYKYDSSHPVYAPNSYGGPQADSSIIEPSWETSWRNSAQCLHPHAEDNDFVQPGSFTAIHFHRRIVTISRYADWAHRQRR